ncbi:hypothetical protein [Micromonospora craniellae]|uniref:Uncharacterized protein n=1 Tax=Micromonospora craniellae TaxID=2294034 RepID=A0A372FU00_9ACTN|nr:hypothetical protein [Micromonospora craniellae]QOC93944.1 hypothetical protein ID554_10165 [Micromonospora craniellae]RFS44010.1 hypothetical protein D0Q02_24365 [Micromonospora craniellae]
MASKDNATQEAMTEEHLVVPFTTVFGVRHYRQSIDLLDLPLPTPASGGAGWIDAYRHWAGR